MSKHYLRIFQEFNIEEVKKSLLIAGDLSGDCAACQALGIDAYTASNCPECGVQFRYVSSRRLESHGSERFRIVKRMKEKRPDLVFVDYDDYKKALGQKQARDFFG